MYRADEHAPRNDQRPSLISRGATHETSEAETRAMQGGAEARAESTSCVHEHALEATTPQREVYRPLGYRAWLSRAGLPHAVAHPCSGKSKPGTAKARTPSAPPSGERIADSQRPEMSRPSPR